MPDLQDQLENGSPRPLARMSLDYRTERSASRLGAWARRTFSREQLINALRSLLWVAPLTVLIWIYAEREQAVPPTAVKVGIEVASADPNYIVTLAPGAEPWVMAMMSGPRALFEAAKEKTEYSGNNASLRIEVSPKLGVGRQKVAAAQIADDHRLTSSGISISSVQPEWIDVIIDPLIERDVAIKAPPGYATITPPTFDPPIIKVRGPEQVLREAEQHHELVAYAALPDPADIHTSQPTVTLKDVKLSLPIQNPNISIVGSPRVTASVELARPEEYTLQYVTVLVTSPPGPLNDFTITYSDTLPNVTVVGSREEIEKLRQPVKATFEIPVDAKEGTATATLKYALPPGVHVKDSAPTQIDYTLTKRLR